MRNCCNNHSEIKTNALSFWGFLSSILVYNFREIIPDRVVCLIFWYHFFFLMYNVVMGERKRNNSKRIIILVLGFLVIFAGVFFGIQFLTKTGIFRVPGVVKYDESLSETELSELKTIFTDEVDLDKDVSISAYETKVRPETKEGEFIVGVRVPVADFYETRTDVNEYAEGEYEEIGINELDDKVKLLSKNGKYYLDDFNAGATFRVLKFDSEKYNDEIVPLIGDKFVRKYPSKDTTLTFAQTGVTAMSRGMNRKLAEVGDATFFAEKISDFLSSFDLTHTSNEASFSDYATGDNICSNPKFIDTLKSIGLDIVELTGNHNQDCGDEAAENTIDIYRENNIKIVGGGKTADEAAVPLEINEKGNGITFLAYNLSTGGATLDDTPGANQYDEDNTCDYAGSSAGDQIGFFRHLIDLGADVVVGTSAHQPQTYEKYGDGVIYYGLGNLFFDQIWWPGTTRSLILAHYFYDGKLLQTKVIPTVYDQNMQTALIDDASAKSFLARLISERP